MARVLRLIRGRLGKVVLVTASVAGVLITLCFFLMPTAFVWIGSRMAYALAPPEYPNSHLVEEEYIEGGRLSDTVLRVYETDDSVDKVLAFMEAHRPGFSEAELPGVGGPAYENTVCDTRLAEFVVPSAASLCEELEGSLPNVQILIYSGTEDSATTVIKIWIDWPIP